MASFLPQYIQSLSIPTTTTWLVGANMESRGKQDLWFNSKPEILESLLEQAIVQSAESSNRIEGVEVERDRLLPLLQNKTKPRTRSEEEVLGYKQALDWIHSKHQSIQITPDTICHLHKIAQSGFSGDAGRYKERNNEIIEILPNGERVVRFIPVTPKNVSKAIEQLCLGYQEVLQSHSLPELLAIATFIFDFLCIHPFRDGNGRVSRLLTTLLLNQHNYKVVKFISLERIIEQSKEDYYEALKQSSLQWHENQHTLVPFWNYFLSHIKQAYRELQERVDEQEKIAGGKSDIVRHTILNQHSSFFLREIVELTGNASPQLIKKVLSQLKAEGKVRVTGKGRSAKWNVLK